jgi:hypothetical protein
MAGFFNLEPVLRCLSLLSLGSFLLSGLLLGGLFLSGLLRSLLLGGFLLRWHSFHLLPCFEVDF